MSDTFNPWLSLWTAPRATIRKLVDTDPSYMVLILALAIGAISGLQGVTELIVSGEISENQMMMKIVGALIGAVVFVLVLYLTGWLYSVVSKWLGGEAPARNLRTVAAWGNVPSLVAGILILICYTFVTKSTDMDAIELLVALITSFFGIWQLVILCKMIGEVNGFSAWKGLGVLIISVLLLLAAAVIIGLTIALLAGVLSLLA
ncbi:Yip1 family protein [Umboniibacter marinipuniceus]|uniref:Yip1-like protein n=1 Tax=Umboniibacter marinipuniceus TaxID=569599 RepID=A0A3M0A9I7_9GAMM|nr:Yip1 family protein [Umboniibacter marinipuniceus]RMA80159.1 Yip1-like protein [Umboniibacter marinipuniceus]